MNSDHELEKLTAQLGEWGRYQCRQHWLHLLGGFLAGLHILSITAVVPTPNHRCFIEAVDANQTNPVFNASGLSQYIPMSSEGGWENCKKYDLGDKNGGMVVNSDSLEMKNGEVGCDGKYVWDRTYYQDSKVIDWGMVCEKRWERAFIQTIYIFGVLIGAIVLGPMADVYGRKKIFCYSGLLQLAFGLLAALSLNFPSYLVILFFYGAFASAGSYVTGFCLSMELVGASKRTLCGTMFSVAFAVGVMVVAIWGYFIPNVTYLQIIYALHSATLIPTFCLVDESYCWLWGQEKYEEAVTIVEKAVKLNNPQAVFQPPSIPAKKKKGTVLPPTEDGVKGSSVSNDAEATQSQKGLVDLFRTPVLRCRALNVAFNWFANAIVYYGLSLNTGNLPGNPFIILFLIGLAEIPGYILVVGLVDKTGRRSLCSSLMLVGGIACIIVAFIPQGIVVTGIVFLAKMGIAGSFAIAYNYTAELFPTAVRNSAVGVGAMAARTSGMLTPLLLLLDSLGKQVPTIIFGSVAIISALLTFLLPETLNKEMPQTIEEGENFGVGDTAYATLFNCLTGKKKVEPDADDDGVRQKLTA